GRTRPGEVAHPFTNRRNCNNVAGGATRLGHAARGLERDVAADAVVPRARSDAAVQQLDRLRREHDTVAGTDELARLVPVARADVDEQILQLDLLVLVLLERGALLADHAGQAAAAGENLDPLREQHLREPAADVAEEEEAL